jgi:hypothetical protein
VLFRPFLFVFSLTGPVGALFSRQVRKVSKLDGPNTFATLQIGATLFTIPAVIAMEVSKP